MGQTFEVQYDALVTFPRNRCAWNQASHLGIDNGVAIVSFWRCAYDNLLIGNQAP